jgi:parvulin-like peptidyl-prolyl isomerase
MRPEMEKAAFALKDGEVSEPVDIPQALIIFQVTGHSHLELKDVGAELERKMKQQKIDEALADVKKNGSVWMDDQYFAAPLRLQEGPTLGAPSTPAPTKP